MAADAGVGMAGGGETTLEEPDRLRDEIRREAERIVEDAEYTGRAHQELGRHWRTWATRLGLPAIVISAATSAGAGLSALAGGASWVTAVLALVGAVAAAIRIFFRPDEQATAHSTKGARYVNIRNEARRLARIDVNSPLSTDALADRVRGLGDRLDGLRLEEPREIPDWAYHKAKAQIDAGSYTYVVDHGVDGR